MIKCPRCKTKNDPDRRFCKECGLLFNNVQPSQLKVKTEQPSEPKVKISEKVGDYVHAVTHAPARFQPYQPAIQCPFCKNSVQPIRNNRTTTGGIIVFIVLLLLCFPLCWVGFLITEQQTFCPSCRMRLS